MAPTLESQIRELRQDMTLLLAAVLVNIIITLGLVLVFTLG